MKTDAEFYAHCDRALRSGIPLLGAWKARRAVTALAARVEEPEAQALLIAAVSHRDEQTRTAADQILRALDTREAVDTLCAAWVKGRDALLGQLITECGYVATQPAEVRVLSHFQAGKPLAPGTAEEVAVALKALGEKDPELKSGAEAALRALAGPGAIDALCAAWAKGRDATLGRLIEECGYVATQPAEVRVLSHFQAGKPLAPGTAEEVAVALKALGEKEAKLKRGAEAALRALATAEAMDALCLEAARQPDSAAGRLAVAQGYRPTDPEMSAVFLIATGQVDAHFAEHQGLVELRAGFARAEPAIKARVDATAHKGDVRLAPFVRQKSTKWRESSAEELSKASRDSIARRDWRQLFTDCQEWPLRHALPGWQALVAASWQPEDPGDAAMLRQIGVALKSNGTGKVQSGKLDPAFSPSGSSTVFEKWLEAGRQPELTRLGEAQLLERMGKAAPPEAVALVAALAAGGKTSKATCERIAQCEHWLIRLAGHLTGLLVGTEENATQDTNHWVREVGGAGLSWNLWPEDATADMMQTAGGPREAALMAQTGPRAILRAVLGQRMKGGEFTVRELPAGTEGGTFRPVDKPARKQTTDDDTWN